MRMTRKCKLDNGKSYDEVKSQQLLALLAHVLADEAEAEGSASSHLASYLAVFISVHLE